MLRYRLLHVVLIAVPAIVSTSFNFVAWVGLSLSSQAASRAHATLLLFIGRWSTPGGSWYDLRAAPRAHAMLVTAQDQAVCRQELLSCCLLVRLCVYIFILRTGL